jgi:hypothetical protein
MLHEKGWPGLSGIFWAVWQGGILRGNKEIEGLG